MSAQESMPVSTRLLEWFGVLRKARVRHVWLRADLYWTTWEIFGAALFNRDGHMTICDVYIHNKDDRR